MAHEKLTYALVNGRRHSIDQTITELVRRFGPAKFLRVHRSVLVNVDWIREVNSWFAGKVILTLKDAQHTQIPVARDRVRSLKPRLEVQLQKSFSLSVKTMAACTNLAVPNTRNSFLPTCISVE